MHAPTHAYWQQAEVCSPVSPTSYEGTHWHGGYQMQAPPTAFEEGALTSTESDGSGDWYRCPWQQLQPYVAQPAAPPMPVPATPASYHAYAMAMDGAYYYCYHDYGVDERYVQMGPPRVRQQWRFDESSWQWVLLCTPDEYVYDYRGYDPYAGTEAAWHDEQGFNDDDDDGGGGGNGGGAVHADEAGAAEATTQLPQPTASPAEWQQDESGGGMRERRA